MQKTGLLAALFLGFLVSACAEHPAAVATENPKVLRSPEDWRGVAHQVFVGLERRLKTQGIETPTVVSFAAPEKETSFNYTFSQMLITELVERGYRIEEHAPIVLGFDVHSVPDEAQIALSVTAIQEDKVPLYRQTDVLKIQPWEAALYEEDNNGGDAIKKVFADRKRAFKGHQ
ncbi:MAG: hypothetical protein ACOYK8_07430 [Alphaproteobacteria bacterium]